jgi:hypothetical protein
MSAKLFNYASKSRLMDISIRWNGEVFKFNLHEELIISEEKINREIKEHANPYAFLKMLHKKLLLRMEEIKMEIEKEKSKTYLRYKNKINDATGKPYNEDYASAKANVSPIVEELQAKYMGIRNDLNSIDTCVSAFEVRKDLLQTLSANARNENR